MVQQIEKLKIAAQKRSGVGSRHSQQLRKQGWLPCIVYDSTGNTFPVQVKRHSFELFLRDRASQNFILDLDVEGDKARKVLLKEIQRDRLSDRLMHADFLEVSMTRKLKVSIPVRLAGEPIGVTQQEGVMEQQLRSVDVECLPGEIVGEFTLDVSNLAIGDNLCVRDIKVDPSKLTILTSPEITVVSVQLPHVEEEKPAEEAAAVEGAVEGQPPAEGAEAAPGAPAEAGKEGKEPGKDAKQAGKDAKQPGKETKEKGKEAAPAEKDKDAKGKAPKGKK